MSALGRGGLTVGPLAFGSAPIGNLGREVAEDEWRGALTAAWDAGVRYFDTAPHYGLGLAERRLAAGLAAARRVHRLHQGRPAARTAVPADDMDDEGYAVPATHVRVRDYSRDGVLRSLESSLERLGLDRVDILFVHDPDEYYREALEGAFPALEELRVAGRDHVIRCRDEPVRDAGRLRPRDRPRRDHARRPLHAARAGRARRPAAGVRAARRVRGRGRRLQLRPARARAPARQTSPTTTSRRRPRSSRACTGSPTCWSATARRLPQAAAQFALAHPAVATVCLGARSAAQVERNAALFDTPVPEQAWQELVAEGLLRETAPVPA